MEKNTKELIKTILEKESSITNQFWRDVLWLQENPQFGIRRNFQVVWVDQTGTHESNWQNFFRKAKIKIHDREIKENLADYLLLLKEDELTGHDILQCRNAQIRAYLLKDYGPDKLVEVLGAKVIHQDGFNQLLHITMGHQIEPIRLVRVKDSTTKNVYLLRVPPDMKRCKQAIAWTFGLEEDEYDPVIET